MVFEERKMNLFEVDSKYYLAHCISADFRLGAGIAVQFNKLYGLQNKFKVLTSAGYEIKVGTSVVINQIINLITKSKYYGKPTYNTLQMALDDMKKQCLERDIKHIAMPRIGCGLDRLSWDRVKEMILQTFQDTDIEILVCKL